MSERIVTDPELMLGRPVVRGTRITDVLAAIAFAAEALKSVGVYPISPDAA